MLASSSAEDFFSLMLSSYCLRKNLRFCSLIWSREARKIGIFYLFLFLQIYTIFVKSISLKLSILKNRKSGFFNI